MDEKKHKPDVEGLHMRCHCGAWLRGNKNNEWVCVDCDELEDDCECEPFD